LREAKEYMYKKFTAIEDLKMSSAIVTITSVISEWKKVKPDNKDLKDISDAIVEIALLVNKLNIEKGNYHIAMSQMLGDKLRAIDRASASERREKLLEKQLNKYKKKEELGL
jgi:DNA-binding cell septation regulator SpoVG